jgi:transcriptional regulator with XRE-family HTH domain
VTTKSAPQLTRPGHYLREVRLAQGKTLRDLSTDSKLDPAHPSKVERGEKSLSIDSLYRLAKALGLHELAKQLAPFVSVARSRSSQPARPRERPVP